MGIIAKDKRLEPEILYPTTPDRCSNTDLPWRVAMVPKLPSNLPGDPTMS